MGKIDEFERKIIDQGMTDEDFRCITSGAMKQGNS